MNNSNLLRASQVAEILNISRSKVFSLIQRGMIPSVRFGRTVRVRPEDLENFIQQYLSPSIGWDNNKLAADTASLEKQQANRPDQGGSTYGK